MTGGSLVIKEAEPAHVAPVFPAFEEMGCQIDSWKNELLISAPARLRRVRTIRTMPYPGFPTDSQALLMAMACVADGTSVFIENIFESRYKHAGELMRLGAKVKVEGRVAVVEGVPVLSGAPVECTDLRGGAALVLSLIHIWNGARLVFSVGFAGENPHPGAPSPEVRPNHPGRWSRLA